MDPPEPNDEQRLNIEDVMLTSVFRIESDPVQR